MGTDGEALLGPAFGSAGADGEACEETRVTVKPSS